jgi:IS30 family transposase
MKKIKQVRYKRLSFSELLTIYVMHKQGKGVRDIGIAITRSISTVNYAIMLGKKYLGQHGLYLEPGQAAEIVYNRMQENRLGRKGKSGSSLSQKAKEYIVEKLITSKFSPEMIAMQMKVDIPNEAVCFKTIYTFIKKERSDLTVLLYEKGVPRRQDVSSRRSKIRRLAAPKKHHISERPAGAQDRSEFGHFECDLIVSSARMGSCAMLNMTDRKARYTISRKVANRRAETVLGVIRGIMCTLPPGYFKSITFDNGAEFGPTEMGKLESYLMKIFYTTAYCPEEKGTVERINRDYRRFFPKGTNFANVTPFELSQAAELINNFPRKCLGGKSAAAVYTESLKGDGLLGRSVAAWLPSQFQSDYSSFGTESTVPDYVGNSQQFGQVHGTQGTDIARSLQSAYALSPASG